MRIAIEARFGFTVDQPTDVLLQFEPATTSKQTIVEAQTSISPHTDFTHVAAQDDLGERIWFTSEGPVQVTHRSIVEVSRQAHDLTKLTSPPGHGIPSVNVPYLFDTRYCLAEKFQPFVEAEFGGTQGGARVAAIRDWIAQHFTYAPGSSTTDTTALDTFVQRSGVCRDYAHVMVTMARASTIPARYVACYAPDVSPQDFHAVAQVFLSDANDDDPQDSASGQWYLVDATGMSKPEDTVIVGVGRDAADVSFLTTFGPSQFDLSEVRVARDE